MFIRQLSGFVVLVVASMAYANPHVYCSPLVLMLTSSVRLNATLHRRTATNVFPTPPTTSSLSKAMTIAAGATFTPPVAYTRYDRGAGACNGQTEGVSNHIPQVLLLF